MSKNKSSKLKQINGKEESFEPTMLDQIWGDTGINKYSTLKEEEYQNYLHDLNKADLQTHASNIGLMPIDNSETLIKRLIAEFQKHISKYTKPSLSKTDLKISKEAKKILEEGK